MNVAIHSTPGHANSAAAELLAEWLIAPGVRNVMLAAGNTPLELYRLVGARKRVLANLNIFALDEYVGVPLDEPRNCANLLRRCVQQGWSIPPAQFHSVSSREKDALASVREHERKITKAGGVDLIILGLGQNGHLGFNEPGSSEDSEARVIDLDAVSVEANRKWFNGDYAPKRGVTVGMKTILAARRVLIMAYGPHKAAAVDSMLNGPRGEQCPASCLQGHADVSVFLDNAAAGLLNAKASTK